MGWFDSGSSSGGSSWVGLIGAGLSMYSKSREAKAVEDQAGAQADAVMASSAANAKISQYDATVAEKDALEIELQAEIALKQHKKKIESLLSSQRAAYGTAGVAINTGSALKVMANTAAEGARDSEMIMYNGKTKADRQRSLAARYRMLAAGELRDAAAQASLIEDAGDYTSKALKVSALSKGITKAFSIWDERD